MSNLNWLAEQVINSGLSKGEIAENLGISRPTLDRYIHDPSRLRMAEIDALKEVGFIPPREESNGLEPIMYTVTANYVRDAPDLQMRLWLRAWLNSPASGDVDDSEKIAILRQEAERLGRSVGAWND